jgi:Ser/Thr protein kinase RdoA (MazF antagonist)
MRALAALRPAVLALGERLDSFGLPATVQHDDLHDRNILISDGSVKIFDWGDACIGNPLFSLRDSLMSIAEWLGVDYRDEPAALEPYSEAYLEGWRHLTPMPSLLEAARLAMPLSIITRLLSWEVAVRNAPPLDREQDAPWVVDLQRELIDMMGRFDATPV